MQTKNSITYKCDICGKIEKATQNMKQIMLSAVDTGITNDGYYKKLRRASVCPECYDSYWSLLNLNFPHFLLDNGKITIKGVDDGDLDNDYANTDYHNDFKESIVDDYEIK